MAGARVDPAKMLEGLHRHFEHKIHQAQHNIRAGADSAFELGNIAGLRYSADLIEDLAKRIHTKDSETVEDDEEVETCQLL